MRKTLIALATLFLTAFIGGAQQLQQLPNDPAVRQGKLDNGMTYYIMHNEKPAQRAEFYLATNVGAIQETPDQDGLAHFLEHMCFNGTKNFPGKGILDYLQSIGASFGGNVNASTGVEQTIYMLNNIPLLRESVVDSCLLIMHDYSHFVTCDPVEIDKERGVILEEKRSRNNASWRMREASMPYYYGDTKYAGCTIIGSEENLKTFKPESLTTFYHTWYRPDLQALIVVGDVDVDRTEAKIKEVFADIPAAENPKPKDVITIPDNTEPLIGIVTDPEAQSSSVEFLWKSEATPEEFNSTVQGMMTDLIKSIYSQIFSERFSDLCAKPDAPFLSGGLDIGNLCETLEVVMGVAQFKDGEALPAAKAFLLEVEKAKRFGFSDGEVERAKAEILSQYEAKANKASTRTNAELVYPLINNFFDNYAYMEPQAEYDMVKMLLPQISSQILNMIFPQLVGPENLVVLYKAPQKEGLEHPTAEQFGAVIKEVEDAELQAPQSEDIPSEFLDPASLKGSKVKKTAEGLYGSTVWTLGNGVKVVLLPTDHEKDRITFSIVKDGGYSLISDEDLPSFEENLTYLFGTTSGVAGYSATTLQKMMSGKQFSVSRSYGRLSHGFTGSSTVKDLESALQLLYLNYTQPRFDQAEFDQAVKQIEAILPNLEKQPNFQLQKVISEKFYDTPRAATLSEELLSKTSLATIERVTKELFKDAAGAVMIMAGDFDVESVKPLVEKYVGSLPKGKKATHWIDRNVDLVDRNVLADFRVKMETPKITVVQCWKAGLEYNYANAVACDALEYILDMVYVATLREEEGGTYGASANILLNREPKQYAALQVIYETNEEQADALRELAVKGLRDLAENGPSAEYFDRTVKNMQKNIPERRLRNSYWVNSLRKWVDYGENYDAEWEAAVNALTPEQIKATAAAIIAGNTLEAVMRPESK